MRYTLDILSKYKKFPIFHRNIGDFIDFLAHFLANRLLVGKIVSIPADIRYFGDILDFLFLGWRIVALKRFIKSLMNSDLSIWTWEMLVTLCFLMTEHIYCVTNFSAKHQKKLIVLGARPWNQDKAGLARLVRKTLHNRASFHVCSVITCR